MITAITSRLLEVSSSAFREDGFIPAKYSCEKKNINPPLSVSHVPAETKSLALIVDDPDAADEPFVHWVMWNIDPAVQIIEEDVAPGIQGKNSKHENKYTGPCPPYGTHHYHFKIYALDTKLNIKRTSGKQALEEAMKDHIIARGELIGLYEKAS